jgi:hypothetical protein
VAVGAAVPVAVMPVVPVPWVAVEAAAVGKVVMVSGETVVRAATLVAVVVAEAPVPSAAAMGVLALPEWSESPGPLRTRERRRWIRSLVLVAKEAVPVEAAEAGQVHSVAVEAAAAAKVLVVKVVMGAPVAFQVAVAEAAAPVRKAAGNRARVRPGWSGSLTR